MTNVLAHVRVLTACTGSKASTTEPVPAEELYTGQHHRRLMRGVTQARDHGFRVELGIVSAGHGIVKGSDLLRPYEKTFQGRRIEDRRRLARDLGIREAARDFLSQSADLHVVLLGEDYLDACEFEAGIRASAPLIVVCGARQALQLPRIPEHVVVAHTNNDTRRFHCGLVGLKGEIGGRLLAFIARNTPTTFELLSMDLLDEIANTPVVPDVRTAALF